MTTSPSPEYLHYDDDLSSCRSASAEYLERGRLLIARLTDPSPEDRAELRAWLDDARRNRAGDEGLGWLLAGLDGVSA